jgi:ADP-heptose:LPS heptosyltransferase
MPANMNHNDKKTLIIHQGSLGDLVVTITAALRILNKEDIVLASRAHLLPLIKKLNVFHHAFSVDDSRFTSLFTKYPDVRIKNYFNKFDKIILFSNSLILIENLKKFARCPVHQIPPRPERDQRIHISDFLTQKLKMIFSDITKNNFCYFNSASKEEYLFSKKILLHPGSGSTRKNWPLPNFIEIYRDLVNKGYFPEWIIGPADKHLMPELKKEGIPEKIICDDLDLTEFVDKLEIAELFIGNDSGLSHLSAFLGKPVITIFGPSDLIRWQPVGPDVKVVKSEIKCAPCFELNDDNCEGIDCLKSITPEHVLGELFVGFENYR